MTTLQSIIGRAFRETQITDIGESPSAAQEQEALDLLGGIIARSFVQIPQVTLYLDGDQKSGKVQDERNFLEWMKSGQPVPSNVILHCHLTAPRTLLMPYSPSDGARIVIVDVAKTFATNSLTLEGNGSTVEGASSLVLATDGQRAEYFFRRDMADWREVTTLGLSQQMPFPSEFDDKFVIELAGRLNPRYGNDLPGITLELYREVNARFKARYQRDSTSMEPDVLFGSRGYGGSDGGLVLR